MPGPGAAEVVARLADGIEEAEFSLTGHFVANIALAGEPEKQADGSLAITIEALTVAE